jgi:hypothetical protein
MGVIDWKYIYLVCVHDQQQGNQTSSSSFPSSDAMLFDETTWENEQTFAFETRREKKTFSAPLPKMFVDVG